MKPSRLLPLAALLIVASFLASCTQTVRSIGRTAKVGAQEAQREVRAMEKAGEIEAATAERIIAVCYEVELTGHNLSLYVNWNALSRADKRRVALDHISQFEGSLKRLDEAGVLNIKSEKARKKIESFKTNFRRGVSALRIIEAAIPVEEERSAASPTPSPEPGTIATIPMRGTGARFGEIQITRRDAAEHPFASAAKPLPSN